jgi:hypothetical protein
VELFTKDPPSGKRPCNSKPALIEKLAITVAFDRF